MRLRPTHLFEQDTAHVAFHLGAGVPGAAALAAALRQDRWSCASPRPARPSWQPDCSWRWPVGLGMRERTRPWSRPRPSHPRSPPTAQPVPPDPRVGAVFLGAGSLHTCTGAVLHSAAGDLILTAAHCVAEGVDATFVAGLNDTAAPEDVWHVDAVYLDPRWVQNQDPLADFAIARVSRDTGGTVEAQAGGGLTLGPARNRAPSSPSPATGWASAAARSAAGRPRRRRRKAFRRWTARSWSTACRARRGSTGRRSRA